MVVVSYSVGIRPCEKASSGSWCWRCESDKSAGGPRSAATRGAARTRKGRAVAADASAARQVRVGHVQRQRWEQP
eukprot:3082638-Pyramimonas_sp.AAC.1